MTSRIKALARIATRTVLSAAVLALSLMVGAGSLAGPATAQSCASDSQCFDSGRPRTTCVGSTLVTRQSICSGTCRTVEVSRVACPGPCVGDRCIGGSLRSGPIPPPSGGGRVPAGACAQVCTCRGNVLTYGLGFARAAADCERRRVDCVYGCSCDPEPRCLKRIEVRR